MMDRRATETLRGRKLACWSEERPDLMMMHERTGIRKI